MALIIILDLAVVCALITCTLVRGLERTLPLASFMLMLFPNESAITLPGLFDLTTQRLIIITLIVLHILFRRSHGQSNDRKGVPLKYLMLLIFAWMVLSAANSVVFPISLKTVISQLFDFFLLYYIVVKNISKTETVNAILFAFVGAMFVCSVFGAVEAYRGWSVMSLFPQGVHRFSGLSAVSDRADRVQVTFGHPILFGGALAIAIPLALYLLTLAETKTRRIFLWSASMLMFLNIYKTSSRGPWLALILSLSILLVLAKNHLRRYLAVTAMLIMTVLIARPGVRESLANLYIETYDPDSPQGQSYQWRYALYRTATEHLNQDFGRALWGYGPESFFYLGWEGRFQGQIVRYESCDSSVAALMIETGYVGLLMVVVLFLKVAIATFRGFRRMPPPADLLCLLLFVNVCAFCFMMTNVAILGWGQQSYMLWILIAISMVAPRLAQPEGTTQETAPSSFEMLSPSSSGSAGADAIAALQETCGKKGYPDLYWVR